MTFLPPLEMRPSFPLALKLLSCAFLFAVASTAQLSAQIIYQNDFDQHSGGIYTDTDLEADWDNPDSNNGVTEGRVTIVQGAEAYGGSGSSLAVSYPAGKHGTQDTGAQWPFELGAGFEEVVLSYRVKFKNGFDFVRGGKLPGLAGGTAPTGNTQADGYNGWTGRLMWRTDFTGVAGSPEQLTANGISYAKYTDSGFDQDGRNEDKEYWFDGNGQLSTLESGQWYLITQRIKMNDPGQFNGVLQISIDGNVVLDQQDIRFRLTDELKIDQMYFSTFFGGNSDWRTSKDEVVYFDDFVITNPNSSFLKVPANYPSVQAAIAAAVPGDTVAVRGGFRENVVVDKAIFLRGYQGTYLQPADPLKPVIRVKTSNVHLKRFDILGGSNGVFVEPGNSNTKIEFMSIRYAGTAINVKEDCNGTWISKCVLLRNTSDGVRVSGSDMIELVDNKSYLNEGHGFNLINVDDADIAGNIAYLSDFDGFNLTGQGHQVFDNKSLNNLGTGFSISNDNHFVVDNLARASGSHGFEFNGSSNCNVTENESQVNEGDGYRLVMASNLNLLDNNNARLNGGVGVLVDFSQTNEVTDCFIYANQLSGVVLTATTMDCTISGNVVTSNKDYGILDQGIDNAVNNNTVRRNGL